jgi:hypothetical protein
MAALGEMIPALAEAKRSSSIVVCESAEVDQQHASSQIAAATESFP